jgi:hypothetical protein
LKRFYFDEEDDGDEEFDELDSQMFSVTQFPVSQNSIVSDCIKLCESSIFWRFLSLESKLEKIKKTYEFLVELEEKEK